MFNLRAFVLTGIAVLLGFFALLGFLAHQETLRTREYIRSHELPALGLAAANQLDRAAAGFSRAGQDLLADGFIRDWILAGEQDVPKLLVFLQDVQDSHDLMNVSIVSDRSETYYGSEGRIVELSPANWERDGWYYVYREAMPDANIDTWYYPETGVLGMWVNYPIRDTDGSFLGVAGGGIDAAEFNAILASYGDLPGVNLYLARRDGQLIYSSVPERMAGQAVYLDSLWGEGCLDTLRRERSAAGTVLDRPGNDSQSDLLWVRYAPEWDTFLILEQTAQEARARTRRIYVQTLLLGGGLVLLLAAAVIGVVYAANRRMGRYRQEQQRRERRRKSVISGQRRTLGNVQLLLREIAATVGTASPLAARLHRSAAILHDTDQALCAYVDDASPQGGAKPPIIDMREMLQGELTQRTNQASMRGIALHTQLPPGPIRARAVPALLRLALDELLLLGIQQSPRDTRIILRVSEQDGLVLEIIFPDVRINPDAEQVHNAREFLASMQVNLETGLYSTGTVFSIVFAGLQDMQFEPL